MYSAKYGGRSGRAKGKAPKNKKKQCSICDAKGHDDSETDCPKRDDKIQSNRPQLGFGKTHKASRKANRSDSSVSQNNNDDDNDGDDTFSFESVFDMTAVEFEKGKVNLSSCPQGVQTNVWRLHLSTVAQTRTTLERW
jgi:hypothetical protein